MIDTILSIFHPSVKREWEAFYPNNVNAIAKFLFHSDTFPSYKNPIDRCSHRHDFLRSLPKKYHDVKIKDLLEIAPYRLMQFVLANQSFVKEAFLREQHYNEVINLLDSCKHGVTSVCNKHFSFTLLGGTRLPKGESFLDGLDVNMRLHHLMGIGAFSDRLSIFEEKSKRGERTPQDVTSIKNAQSVDYDDLDILFQDLYSYCSEIQYEEKRVVDLLHKEDIEEQFKKEVSDNELRKIYFKDFLKSENHDKDSNLEQKEYCIQHLRFLDAFISKQLEAAADVIANSWPLGYEWYERINSDPDFGHMLEGDDFLFDCIKRRDFIKKKNETILAYQTLCSKYPNAIEAYNDAHQIVDDNLCKVFIPSHENVIKIGEDKLKEYEQNAQIIKFYKNWIKTQVDYSNCCRSVREKLLPSWGCYRYDIPFKSITYDGKEVDELFAVWQIFAQSFCLDDSLDYTNKKDVLEKTRNLIGFKNKNRLFREVLYDNLMLFLQDLHKKYGEDLVVLFGTSGIEDYQSFNDFHFSYLRKKLSEAGIQFKQIVKEPRSITENARYVIIEVITENNHMRETCQHVLSLKHNCYATCNKSKRQDCFSDIIYISLNKGYDSNEMQTIITKTNRKIEKQKEIERKKLEEEKKKREEELLRIKQQQEVLSQLQGAVSTWDTLVGGLKYSYLFYYYPTTCDFEATEEEWYYRRLVWDFKNTPGKTSPVAHQIALRKAVLIIKNKLFETFNSDNLKHLTLVCIPASSQAKTQARYEVFSNRICGETGLINAYSHISVVSEREERHLGGTGMNTGQIAFDESFFKGKYVLLFDDVVTRGDSMRTFKRKMESLGAIVIGGLSLGKTKHERPIKESISNPFTRPVFPPQPTTISDDDDFPF